MVLVVGGPVMAKGESVMGMGEPHSTGEST